MTPVARKKASVKMAVKTTCEVLSENLDARRKKVLRSRASAIAYLKAVGGMDQSRKGKRAPL